MDKVQNGKGLQRRSSVACLQDLKAKLQEMESKEIEKFSWLLEDRFLLHFIRGCKYDTDRAFQTLLNYISVRKRWAALFRELLPSKAKEVCKVLNHRGPQEQLIVVMRASWWDTAEQSGEDYLRSGMLNHEEVWNDEETERNGVIAVWDTQGFTYSQTLHVTPWFIQKVTSIFLRSFPMRINAIHVLNVPLYFKLVFNAVKHILPAKFRDRMFMHGHDLSTFYDHFPQEKLPQWLGGPLLDEQAFRQDFFPNILKKEEYYKQFAALL